MKEQHRIWINLRSSVIPMLGLLLTGACTFGHASAAVNTVGVGRPYASRDPRPCGDLTGGAPTQQKALNSFICHEELVWGSELRLVENATLQLGNPRAYNYKEDYNVPNIDLTAKVYPIRGSFTKYGCVPFSDYMKNKGRNCSIAEHPNATGLCYRDTWGNWLCAMGDVSFKVTATEVPPPGFAAGGAPVVVAGRVAGPASVPVAASAPVRQAEASYPKPDFSEMEKWFDILRYEYGDNVTDHNLYIWVRAKASNLPSFCMQFLDRDGMMIDASDSSCGTGIHMGYNAPQAGQVAKFDVPMPREKNMPRVVSARAFRIRQ